MHRPLRGGSQAGYAGSELSLLGWFFLLTWMVVGDFCDVM